MVTAEQEALRQAMEKLRAAERARWEAISELKKLGYIRSRSIVGDFGEELAKSYYGVELEAPSTAGYDLVSTDGKRVQVKTLRATPGNQRRTIGTLKPEYDLLLAIRLDQDYEPLEAIEAPRRVVERHFGRGRVTWTDRFEADPGVRQITPRELLRS